MKRIVHKGPKILFLVTLGLALLFLFAPNADAQEQETKNEQKEQQAVTKIDEVKESGRETLKPKPEPVYRDYKGVKIGMSADEVRQTLNNLKDKGEHQDFFVLSDNEVAQVFYDNKGLVRAISVTYMGDLSNAPTPIVVFGEELVANADGSMYKLVRYPQAGYWISYNRIGSEKPIITVTMQRMRLVSN